MKVEQAKAVEQVKSLTGANVGDKVIFSHRVAANHSLVNITLNKVYEIEEIMMSGITVIKCDNGKRNFAGGGYDCLGEYDIIERAPQPEPKFQPVTITLETQAEVDFVTSLIGATNRDQEVAFGVEVEMIQEWDKLDNVASENRNYFNVELA